MTQFKSFIEEGLRSPIFHITSTVEVPSKGQIIWVVYFRFVTSVGKRDRIRI